MRRDLAPHPRSRARAQARQWSEVDAAFIARRERGLAEPAPRSSPSGALVGDPSGRRTPRLRKSISSGRCPRYGTSPSKYVLHHDPHQAHGGGLSTRRSERGSAPGRAGSYPGSPSLSGEWRRDQHRQQPGASYALRGDLARAEAHLAPAPRRSRRPSMFRALGSS